MPLSEILDKYRKKWEGVDILKTELPSGNTTEFDIEDLEKDIIETYTQAQKERTDEIVKKLKEYRKVYDNGAKLENFESYEVVDRFINLITNEKD